MILALDLSSTVGWAVAPADAPLPRFGHIELPTAEGIGAAFSQFQVELERLVDELIPELIVVEQHIPLAAMNHLAAARQAFTLDSIVRIECYRTSIEFLPVEAGAVRQSILGRAHFPAGKVKAAVVSQCRAFGWRVSNDHEADACLVWAYVAARRGGRSRARQGLLVT